MSGDQYVKTREQSIDCITSFHQAMQDAGGSLLSFDLLKSMSLLEFMTTIAAQNNIRFYYKQPVEKCREKTLDKDTAIYHKNLMAAGEEMIPEIARQAMTAAIEQAKEIQNRSNIQSLRDLNERNRCEEIRKGENDEDN